MQLISHKRFKRMLSKHFQQRKKKKEMKNVTRIPKMKIKMEVDGNKKCDLEENIKAEVKENKAIMIRSNDAMEKIMQKYLK